MSEAVGIMDPAFFVGKNILINWINEFLETSIKKVEDMATGAYYCQLLDAIYPGKVPLHKVNFGAKFDYEFVKNFQVLQSVFVSQGVQKHVDVTKLVKAKYQDNLEFFQWMKRFFDTHYSTSNSTYPALEKRKAAIKAYSSQFGKGGGGGGGDEKKSIAAPKAVASSAPAKKTTAPAAKTTTTQTAAKKPATTTTTAKSAATATAAATEDKTAEIEELNSKLNKLKLTIEGLEKERNFYFGKLRQIEVLCQQDETKDVETKAAVLKILYQTDNEEEFQSPAAETPAAAEGEAATGEAAAATTEIQGDITAEASAEVPTDDLLSSGNAEETF